MQMRKFYDLIDRIPPEDRWKGLLGIPLTFGLIVLWLEIVERWKVIGYISLYLMLFHTAAYLAIIIIDTICNFFKCMIKHDEDDEYQLVEVPDDLIDAIMSDEYHHEIVLDTDGRTVIGFRAVNKK